jgi:RES domain-containing protein
MSWPIEYIHVYRVCNIDYVRPHNGYGSTMRNGGRWNSNKYPCIYTGANRSVAQLEWISHSLVSEFDFPNLIMITYAIPKSQIFFIDMSERADWIDNELLTKRLGDDFLNRKEYIALCVPSAMDSKESNYIINPNHPDFSVAEMVIDDNEGLILNKRFFEAKEFVKNALSLNLPAKLDIDAKLDKYISEGKSGGVFKRSRQRRRPKK